MDAGARDQMSLAFLKRADDEITEVLGSAAFVTMYLFDSASQAWNRSECEGPLFVVKRNNNPRFQMIVMNRLSRSNEVHDITASFFAECIEPYLIFRSNQTAAGDSDIHGTWFPDPAERQRIFQLLQRLISAQTVMESDNIPSMQSIVKAPTSPAPKATPPTQQQQQQQQPTENPSDPGPTGTANSRNSGAPKLLTPAMILGEGNVPTLTGGKGSGPAAEKAALKAAVVALLDDEAFLDMIHQKYTSMVR
uniref:mRNA-decapping enzyme C-terminal domain-containing protein n=1 Tax=Rhizochromulina marina TaxID=1034831 RepID=A0A7S2RPJ6_9STRA|mmetsp:Transcript_18692/g.54461  ORF Transcript_18692/g.54461 Transcript_18692/m.54461 type:complete len:250 (+) Transcript_18692:127-876(+)|eukprot:CAMPEP_0118961946 /NCGR_PEP_ID=MMETSP1173-20130426/459_1 /TAXON_ID=1034831 /ORGANISM="Rhizochromulina marina cf, Strain CCMP1243" /LENGTH=249 /DNA_ID=CAMNT_0006910151 /DNA_START=101 /DNA_END=850 /DNA_ORIENTATION=+